MTRQPYGVWLISLNKYQDVDPALASSLRRVQQYANAQAEIKADLTLVGLFGVMTKSVST